jgi:hypothetical protein
MEQLISEIDAFLASQDLKETTFGEAALRDRHFVRQLRAGREPRSRTVAKVRQYMDAKAQQAG